MPTVSETLRYNGRQGEDKKDHAMRLTVSRLTVEDLPLLDNLYQFYLYDYTDFMPWDVGPDGRYAHHDLDNLFDDSDQHAFLLQCGQAIGGFALISTFDPPEGEGGVTASMDEFFVMRTYRRHGIGRWFAIQMFETFPGVWRVSQLPANTGAIAFWRAVIGAYTGGVHTQEIASDGDNVIYFKSGNNGLG